MTKDNEQPKNKMGMLIRNNKITSNSKCVEKAHHKYQRCQVEREIFLFLTMGDTKKLKMLNMMLKDTKNHTKKHCRCYGQKYFTFYIFFKPRIIGKHGKKDIGGY